MNNELFEKVDNYIANLLGTEDETLKHATRMIELAGIPDASVSANQGKFLQILALASGAKRILELGTLGAYSAIWMARALPAEGKLITIEYDEKHAHVAQKNIDHAGLSNIVDIRLGKAMDILPKIVEANEGPFDLIFIDADKPPYTEYFQYALKLSRKGTIVVCDNVVRNGKVLDENSDDEKVQGVQRLGQFLSTCNEASSTILQTVGVKEYDGLVLAVVH